VTSLLIIIFGNKGVTRMGAGFSPGCENKRMGRVEKMIRG